MTPSKFSPTPSSASAHSSPCPTLPPHDPRSPYPAPLQPPSAALRLISLHRIVVPPSSPLLLLLSTAPSSPRPQTHPPRMQAAPSPRVGSTPKAAALAQTPSRNALPRRTAFLGFWFCSLLFFLLVRYLVRWNGFHAGFRKTLVLHFHQLLSSSPDLAVCLAFALSALRSKRSTSLFRLVQHHQLQ